MKIFYGRGAYGRTLGSLPELKLVNMFVEQSPVNEDGVVLQSRKGLVEHSEVGPGPIRGVFREPGVFDGDVFTVSGGFLYRNGGLVGAMAGSGPVSFAASASELAINAGGPLYRYDGTDFEAVSFPDAADVCKVLYHDGLFIALREGDDKFYASGVLDASDWDALSFKAAESAPDFVLDAEVLTETIYFFGQSTIEPWTNDDSGATVPYSPIELATIDKGIRDTGCLVKMDQAILFVSNENMVMELRGGAATRVSDHGIEERLAASSDVSMFGYVHEGHSFACVRLDQGTWALDLATKQWNELATLGLDNFLVSCATRPGPEPLFGGDKLYTFDGWEDDTYSLERRFTAGIPLNGGTLQIDAISLNASSGTGGTAEMRSSRDGGRTWGAWRSVSLGETGEYRSRVRWRRVGMFDEPGALIEFRCTDAVGFRVGGVYLNELGGGRSRA